MYIIRQTVVEMGEREDNVYKAKLTEQAERYDGKCSCGVCNNDKCLALKALLDLQQQQQQQMWHFHHETTPACGNYRKLPTTTENLPKTTEILQKIIENVQKTAPICRK